MRRALITFVALTLALAGAAAAQISMVRPIPQAQPAQVQAGAVAPDAARLAQDLSALRNRVGKLESQLGALQSDVQAIRASTVFACISGDTSRNGAGVTENCSPYGCNPIDGRCRTTAAHSGHCAAGFVWCVYYNSCTTATGCNP